MIEKQAFYELLNQVLARLNAENEEETWIPEDEAMQLLNIRSKTTMQRIRNEDLVRFTQPTQRIILYDKQSLLDYLDNRSNR